MKIIAIIAALLLAGCATRSNEDYILDLAAQCNSYGYRMIENDERSVNEHLRCVKNLMDKDTARDQQIIENMIPKRPTVTRCVPGRLGGYDCTTR